MNRVSRIDIIDITLDFVAYFVSVAVELVDFCKFALLREHFVIIIIAD